MVHHPQPLTLVAGRWPSADIIERYYLTHTSPVEVVLPLAALPLLLTAAGSGAEVCLWRREGAVRSADLVLTSCRNRRSACGGATAPSGSGSGPARGCSLPIRPLEWRIITLEQEAVCRGAPSPAPPRCAARPRRRRRSPTRSPTRSFTRRRVRVRGLGGGGGQRVRRRGGAALRV